MYTLLLFLLHHALAQKCPAPTPIPTAPPPPPFSALPLLIDTSLEDFFSTTFEKESLHIPNEQRTTKDWQNLFADLSINLDTLLTGVDDVTIISSNSSHDNAKPVQISDIQTALQAGHEIAIHHMHKRNTIISHLTESLRQFFICPVTTQFNLRTHPRPGDISPTLYPEDVFLIPLNDLSATLFEDIFPYPTPHHLQNRNVLQAAFEAAQNVVHKHIPLHPGDVLYIPRGHGVDIRNGTYILIRVSTYAHTVHSGIIATIDSVRGENVLEEAAGGTMTWREVLKGAVEVAAEFTPELRRHLAVSEELGGVLEDVWGEGVPFRLSQAVGSFVAAAKEGGLKEAVVEVLKEEGRRVAWGEGWEEAWGVVGEREFGAFDGFQVVQLRAYEEVAR